MPAQNPQIRNPDRRGAGGIIAWIFAILLAVVFGFAGWVKLISAPAMVQSFAQMGAHGQQLRYITGVLECAGAIGVLIPRVRFWAALDIAMVMVGATYTNIVIVHTPGVAILTVGLLAITLALAWLRRPRTVLRTARA
jgi:putative oxidoreductase